MQAIIKGKIYNTETATLIARGDNDTYPNDCWYLTEALYRTPRGNYFIVDQARRIIPVSDKGRLCVSHEYCLDSTIHGWLETWNVGSLPPREIEYFGLTEA